MAEIGDIVLVHWLDSALDDSRWCSRDEAQSLEPASCLSVGWLMALDEDRLVLAASWSPDEVGEVVAIPRACVIAIYKLATGKPLE